MKKRKSVYSILAAVFVFVGTTSIASAQDLSEFQGLTEFVTQFIGPGSGGLPELFNALFNLAVLAGSTLAVIMIAIAGIQYMTTDAVWKKKDGITRIQYAVAGLLMLLGTWLFFNEINPNVLRLDFELDSVELPAPPDRRTLPYTPPPETRSPNQFAGEYSAAQWLERGQGGCDSLEGNWKSEDPLFCKDAGVQPGSSVLCCVRDE